MMHRISDRRKRKWLKDRHQEIRFLLKIRSITITHFNLRPMHLSTWLYQIGIVQNAWRCITKFHSNWYWCNLTPFNGTSIDHLTYFHFNVKEYWYYSIYIWMLTILKSIDAILINFCIEYVSYDLIYTDKD